MCHGFQMGGFLHKEDGHCSSLPYPNLYFMKIAWIAVWIANRIFAQTLEILIETAGADSMVQD